MYCLVYRSRWVRLLFSREFPFDQTLVLWDTLFSVDPSFKLIDLVCTAMLIRIRWDRKTHMPLIKTVLQF